MTSLVYESDLESLVESLFAREGWETRSARAETFGSGSTLGRGSTRDAVLFSVLLEALTRLNPGAPEAALLEAQAVLLRDRSTMLLPKANQEMHELLRSGVAVSLPSARRAGEKDTHVIRVIDWDDPSRNRFQLVRQLTISGSTREFRADLIGFVNGLPLLFIELKKPDKRAKEAFDKNFSEYKKHIPQLFWANAIVLVTNGTDARVGSLTSAWEHFKSWGRVDSEGEPRVATLDTLVRALCAPRRLLDVCENFVLFEEHPEGLRKVVAQNHQVLGVNLAFDRVRSLAALRAAGAAVDAAALAAARKLGVFWHTQGSGKSYSMVFFARKVLRKIRGSWTFVVVTDRQDLDDQISKTFIRTGTAAETARAESARQLRAMLSASEDDAARSSDGLVVAKNTRFVFTLIQKFRNDRPKSEIETDDADRESPDSAASAPSRASPYDSDRRGETDTGFPVLSTRDDIIVMADEAHRSQYDTFARNLSKGLPASARIGFTGTPLLDGDQTTVDVFGDYVSQYRFFQAVEDGATVPLYYEGRVSDLHLDSDQLDSALRVLEAEEDLSDGQRETLSERFGNFSQVIARTTRLRRIAADMVEHFSAVDDGLKAMAVCLDKPTTIRLYRYFCDAWGEQIAKLRDSLVSLQPWDSTRPFIEAAITRMESLDTAVVLSRSQSDVDYIRAKDEALDAAWIEDVLARGAREDLAKRFKDPGDRLRLVFVCSMWITGFDAPACGVVYIDKPMRNHTLMQTIARANRVHAAKEFGLVVDYVGVLGNLDEAFRDFAGRAFDRSDRPVEDKSKIVATLDAVMVQLQALLSERGASLAGMFSNEPVVRAAALNRVVELLVFPEEVRARFMAISRVILRLHRGIGLDDRSARYERDVRALRDVRAAIRAATEDEREIADRVLAKVGPILDRAITADAQTLPLDVARIDLVGRGRAFAASLEAEESPTTRADTEALAAAVRTLAEDAARKDPVLVSLVEKLDTLVKRYNEGGAHAGRVRQGGARRGDRRGRRARGASARRGADPSRASRLRPDHGERERRPRARAGHGEGLRPRVERAARCGDGHRLAAQRAGPGPGEDRRRARAARAATGGERRGRRAAGRRGVSLRDRARVVIERFTGPCHAG
jgi:type I restriction enzyme R subunit